MDTKKNTNQASSLHIHLHQEKKLLFDHKEEIIDHYVYVVKHGYNVHDVNYIQIEIVHHLI